MARSVTPNYGFVLYDSGDWAQLLSVYNVAITQIDALVRRLNDDIVSNTARIIALEKRMADAENRLDNLENRMADAENRLDNLEQRMDTAETNITNLQNDLQSLTNTVNNMGKKYDAAIQAIIDKAYGGGTLNDNGSITWGQTGSFAVGNMNVYGGSAETSYIRCNSNGDNDIKAI